jgi:BirA family biotin operon repressor/biotin-[acetyl-CoA-carboxylase] ligase
MIRLVQRTDIEVMAEVDSTHTLHQTDGRGRLQRKWESSRGASLTFSIPLPHLADHPMPWLIGFGFSLAAAKVCGSCLQWPNDLTLHGRKLGGVLVEMINCSGSTFPVVGIGINLKPQTMPSDLDRIVISLEEIKGRKVEPLELADSIMQQSAGMEAPQSWQRLRDEWMEFDETPGKWFVVAGERPGEAVGIGENGELLCKTSLGVEHVLAADALFGDNQVQT